LGEKIEATIHRVVANVFNAVKDLLVLILSTAFELFLEVLEKSMARAAGPIIDDILETADLPPSVRSHFEELRNPTEQGSALGLGGLVGGLGMTAASSMFAPIFRLMNYTMDRQFRTARADPAIAWALSWRDQNVQAQAFEGMKELGWTDALIDAFKEAARPRVSEIDMFRAMLRGNISTETVHTELHKRGWDAADRDVIEGLMQLIPGPQDLVTMAVREAFSPEAIRELGLGAEFPGEFAEWMEKQGFGQEWALRYWYAHWDLPSLSAGYQMLHRDVIDTADLKSLLKAQDVSPVWRDRLIEISYSPLTRVDVRRMYGLGVLDRAGVKKAYRELGYNDVNAERLAEFTVLYETDDSREATKSDILSGFREGMISRAEAVDWLTQINYSSEYAGYFVDKESAAMARKLQDSQTSSIKTLYINHDITEGEARTKLTSIGLASGEIDAKISDWRITREAKTKRPSKGTLDSLLKQDVITDSEYRQQAAFLGYQDQYLDWYLELVLADKAETARKAEEAARSEQESIRTRKVKSDYQIAKAGLDVSLAELATAVAEMQLAIRARQVRYRKELVVVRKALTAAELEQAALDDLEAFQDEIAGARDAILFLKEKIDQNETAVAGVRLEEVEYMAKVKAKRESSLTTGELAAIEKLETQIADAKAASSKHLDQIDLHQTAIAESRLAEIEYVTELQDRLAKATTEEAVAKLEEEAAGKTLEFETARLKLAVEIEKVQDAIADLNTKVLALERDAESKRARLWIEEEAADRGLEFDEERRKLALVIEQAQADIGMLVSSISGFQRSIAERRTKLREELDIVVTLVSEANLTAKFDADLASMRVQLDSLRINAAELKEQKAQLAVGYRGGLTD